MRSLFPSLRATFCGQICAVLVPCGFLMLVSKQLSRATTFLNICRPWSTTKNMTCMSYPFRMSHSSQRSFLAPSHADRNRRHGRFLVKPSPSLPPPPSYILCPRERCSPQQRLQPCLSTANWRLPSFLAFVGKSRCIHTPGIPACLKYLFVQDLRISPSISSPICRRLCPSFALGRSLPPLSPASVGPPRRNCGLPRSNHMGSNTMT